MIQTNEKITRMKSSLNAKRPVTFVICAAGKGERFTKHGIRIPKPLLLVEKKTMIQRSIDSLAIEEHDQLIIISQRSHQLSNKIENDKAEWLEIDHPTKGQLDTFSLAIDIVKNQDIVIYNCDTEFLAPLLREEIESAKFDGIIPCSKEPGNEWSFCQVDHNHYVIKVKEKERISNWASVGYYYFRGKKLLQELTQLELQRKGATTEAYVAPLYNLYLERKLKIKMHEVESFKPFGTLEQLKKYWNINAGELIDHSK